MSKKYKDCLGREIKVEFSMGGYDDDIPVCKLFQKVDTIGFLSKIGMIPKYTYKEVYLGVHSSFVDKISRWEEEDFDKFALDVISKYNDVLIAEEKLKFINKKMYEINQKGYDRDN